jgi:hypothetical protein
MPPGRIPAFIVVNGHGGDKYSWYAWFTGITYARAGAAVLTYDQAGEGEQSIHGASFSTGGATASVALLLVGPATGRHGRRPCGSRIICGFFGRAYKSLVQWGLSLSGGRDSNGV